MNFLKTHPYKGAYHLVKCTSGEEAVDRLSQLYNKSISIIRNSFAQLAQGSKTELDELTYKEATYPYVGISVAPEHMHIEARLAFGIAMDPGVYGTTVTRPDLFGHYYREQIDFLIHNHKIPVMVGSSDWPIPLPFALDNQATSLEYSKVADLKSGVTLPNLSRVNDDIANGSYQYNKSNILPLALFSGERVDFSLHRLHHYTGTSAEHFQNFILLTNYQRYIEEFKQYALEEIKHHKNYTAFVEPGDYVTYNQHFGNQHFGSQPPIGERLAHLPQMPAYHLKQLDHQGITFINIGVGPSNAKTITDHLAVLRPHCWLMLGHCAGLRRSQLLGDYVLPHAYVRDDHVLDHDLPLAVPLPSIAEIQIALQEAVVNITGQRGLEMKTQMRTGTVFCTNDRDWELRSKQLFPLFQQTRAIAVDMESATIAGNGFRFRVPYGALLCVSDKPIHGEIKLRGMANNFYQERIYQHLRIGLEAIRLLQEGGVKSLHSRKLRGFDEPPFR